MEIKNYVTLHDKEFVIYKSSREIEIILKTLAESITSTYHDKNPVLLVMLNGAFIFAADLFRLLDFNCEVQFIKASSYEGTKSTGDVTFDNIEKLKLSGRHIIIVEDIVDTGLTLSVFIENLKDFNPVSVEICSLLDKSSARVHEVNVAYSGLVIPNKFVVGYGLDYDELGRNLPHIYQLKED